MIDKTCFKINEQNYKSDHTHRQNKIYLIIDDKNNKMNLETIRSLGHPSFSLLGGGGGVPLDPARGLWFQSKLVQQ